ncbi:ATP-NAD kinase-like domain-containing protein [Myxozyma melibiosi]|uniref:ATP-NAD kinase-like domain-containing protein n=1 Tax=Myxozyma melibiosi TaxID=54550 RepID=A0ABR1F332_9ASCO
MVVTSRTRSPGPLDPVAPASHTSDFESSDNTSSDEEGRGVEVLVDARHRIASRRRNDSLTNANAGAFLAGLNTRSGCLLHALLDTERETRRRSLEFRRPSFIDGDPESSDEDYYVSDTADAMNHTSKPAHRARRNSISPPPDLLAKTGSTKTNVPHKGARKHHLSHYSSSALTKKQLAEMAYSVRDLSKYLGTLRIKMRVKKIIVVAKLFDKETIAKASEFVDWILGYRDDHHHQYIIYVEDILKDNALFDSAKMVKNDPSKQDRLRYWTPDICHDTPQIFDLVVTLGGDGTVLYTSTLFQQIVPPVLSFNLGSLGFLTKFEFDSYSNIINRLVSEGVIVSLRMRFECTVMTSLHNLDDHKEEQHASGVAIHRDLSAEILDTVEATPTHTPRHTASILNDVVVDRGLTIYVDDEHITTVEADGLVIATPTGSTAYSLSAGGSLVHPDIPGILISPICAHTLSFRPLVIPDSVVLRIGVPYNARTSAMCSFDGKDRVELKQGDYLTISASRFPFPMIQSKKLGSDWFESLSTTLNWNQRKVVQKAFDAL